MSSKKTGSPFTIEEMIERAQQPPSTFIKEFVRPLIIQVGEKYSRFLVWDDEQFLGFRASREAAIDLAHQQKPGTSIYVHDKEGVSQDYQNSFVVVAGSRGRLGPLTAQIVSSGLVLAAGVLADNVTDKRDIMVQVHGELRRKYNGNLPPLDSPPNLDREEWERVTRDFENAQIWRDRFHERHP